MTGTMSKRRELLKGGKEAIDENPLMLQFLKRDYDKFPLIAEEGML